MRAAATLVLTLLLLANSGCNGCSDSSSVEDLLSHPEAETLSADVPVTSPDSWQTGCVCGDGECVEEPCGEGWKPGLMTCSADCAVCGDGGCDPGEGPLKCPADCCGSCGDGWCKGGLCGETAAVCPADCSAALCGDGKCEAGENPVDCPGDCEPYLCGNGTCEPGEAPATCPGDCAEGCGDCECGGGESYWSCPADCGFCGDGYCVANCGYAKEDAAVCPDDCCTPDCEGRECGSDGCGGTCGQCAAGESCGGSLCVACEPQCEAKECGDDGCGASCGQCGEGENCLADGTCECFAHCEGRECGPDGCAGSCGICSGPQDECVDGLCSCLTDCGLKECGDDGCGGVCGLCPKGQECVAGQCPCVPDCDGKVCGGDGCGGTCGECGAGEKCLADATCRCFPDCAGKVCGSNGCGGECGACAPGHQCVNDKCECQFNCQNKDCGPDGCGGLCGECAQGVACAYPGICECVPDCEDKACGSDGCGGECGPCPPGIACVLHTCVEKAGDGDCDDGNDVVWDGCSNGLISEFQANGLEGGSPKMVDVAVVSDQAAVLVWQREEPPGSAENDIFIRPFVTEAGFAYGEDIVNTKQAGNQIHANISTLNTGGFVVSWLSVGDGGQDQRVVARLYDGFFSPVGEEFEVAAAGVGEFCCPAVAAYQAVNDFVVTWGGLGNDGSGYGVLARRFFGTGEPAAFSYVVNETKQNDQNRPAAVATITGNLVIAWETPSGFADATNINFQRYDATGITSGFEEEAATPSPASRQDPAVSELGGQGGFALAWARCPSAEPGSEGAGDGSGCGVFVGLLTRMGHPRLTKPRSTPTFPASNWRRTSLTSRAAALWWFGRVRTRTVTGREYLAAGSIWTQFPREWSFR